MPFNVAMSVALLDWPTLFLCVYVLGLVLTARHRNRLASHARFAIWGYGLLSAGTLASIAATALALTLRGALATTERTPLFLLTASSALMSLVGAALVLLAVVGIAKRSGAV